MGEVWRARHTTLGTLFAIKLVPTSADPELVKRLLLEARAAASIVSPNVVRIFDHGHDGTLAYIAMELLLGETLAARLRRVGRLSAHATALVVRDVAQGIAIAHNAGIIHRDLKPENVFLTRSDNGEIAKVLDFGIAKSASNPGLMTSANVVVGTPAYLSREQVMGTHAVDQRADLWALAIVAYECLTGRLPYGATTMAELFVQIVGGTSREGAAQSAELPPGFGAWFLRATHPDPDQRFPSARALAEELARVLAPDLSILPWEIGASMRNIPIERKPRGVWIAAVLGTLAIGLVILATREAIRSRNPPPALGQELTQATSTADAPPAPAGAAPAATATAVATATSEASAPSSAATPLTSSSASAPSSTGKPIRRYPGQRPNRWGL